MPRLHNIGSADLTMYYGDHSPPHFHVRSPMGDALIGINQDFPVLKGEVPKHLLKQVRQWAAPRLEGLQGCWNLACKGEPVETWVSTQVKPTPVHTSPTDSNGVNSKLAAPADPYERLKGRPKPLKPKFA